MQAVGRALRIVITGANRGLGLELARQLSLKKELNQELILTVRNIKTQQEVLQEIRKLNEKIQVNFHELEVSSSQSVQQFAAEVAQKYGQIDVLVNNAGVYLQKSKGSSSQVAKETFATNYFGTVELTESLLPLLSDQGQIIMVSSELGSFRTHGNQIKETFSNEKLDPVSLKTLADEYINSYATNNQRGWKTSQSFISYGATQVFLNAYTRFHLSQIIKENQNAYTMTPGWCQTDMGGQGADRTPEQGVDTIVYLIHGTPNKRDESLNGKFFYERKVIEF